MGKSLSLFGPAHCWRCNSTVWPLCHIGSQPDALTGGLGWTDFKHRETHTLGLGYNLCTVRVNVSKHTVNDTPIKFMQIIKVKTLFTFGLSEPLVLSLEQIESSCHRTSKCRVRCMEINDHRYIENLIRDSTFSKRRECHESLILLLWRTSCRHIGTLGLFFLIKQQSHHCVTKFNAWTITVQKSCSKQCNICSVSCNSFSCSIFWTRNVLFIYRNFLSLTGLSYMLQNSDG